MTLLLIRGIIVDTVHEFVRPRGPQPWLNDVDRLNQIRAQQSAPMSDESVRLISSLSLYPTGDCTDDVYWRNVTAKLSYGDGPGEPAPPEDIAVFPLLLGLDAT